MSFFLVKHNAASIYYFLTILSLSPSLSAACSPDTTQTLSEIKEIINHRYPHPIHVGFDVDDTLLFSTPSFVLGKAIFSINNDDWKKDPQFWFSVNNDLAYVARKKTSMQAVIDYHIHRNDEVVFMTNRPQTQNERLSLLISNYFHIPFYKRNSVLFKNRINGKKIDKDSYINNLNINLFYGDSDEDVDGKNRRKLTSIRVMRSSASQNTSHYHPGLFCEYILANSDK